MTRAILAGEPGQRADLALINAGAAIYAAGVAQTLAEGVQAARAAIEDGRAAGALERYLEASRRTRPRRPRDESAPVGGQARIEEHRAAAHRRRDRAMSADADRAERILASTREELERRKRELPPQELEYQAFAIGGARRDGAAALRGRAAGARDRGDRRVQATLALGGSPARGAGPARARRAPTSAAARARCRC